MTRLKRARNYVCVYFVVRSKEVIIKSFLENDFLKNLEKTQMQEIVECMYQKEFKKDQYIIREGAVGTELYIIKGQ